MICPVKEFGTHTQNLALDGEVVQTRKFTCSVVKRLRVFLCVPLTLNLSFLCVICYHGRKRY